MKKLIVSIIVQLCSLLVLSTAAGAANPEITISTGQSVYVPVYSHIYGYDREQQFLLTVTLSIRNLDMSDSITVYAVDYYDSNGKFLRSFIDKTVAVPPMASVRYIVDESDKSGGSGAKFIVRWKSLKEVNAPIIEGIMIGTRLQQGISFTSRGQAIRE